MSWVEKKIEKLTIEGEGGGGRDYSGLESIRKIIIQNVLLL